MKCSFCGFVFEESGARHQCQGCLLAGGCRSVRCPRCGYEMPEEIKIIKRIQEWRERMRTRRSAGAVSGGAQLAVVEHTTPSNGRAIGCASRGTTAIPLAAMRPGESGVVVDLCPGDDGQVQKCLALGILPGVTITLRKRSPSFIFDIGFSQFAVDEGMASAVLVQPSRR
jgi:Fe2+ transport system protein FeoA